MRSVSPRWFVPFTVLVLILGACGDNGGDSSDTTLTQSTATTQPATTTLPETATTTAPTATTTVVAVPVEEKYPGLVMGVVSHETTQDIWVSAPGDSDSGEWGTWPIVYALHGWAGSGDDLAITAAELASQGVVVFAPDYRSTDPDYWEQDAECGYRYAMSIAEEYGGDLEQPVTFVGHSLAATLVLVHGLGDAAYGPGGTYDECFSGVPRPDVIVPLSGCHYHESGSDQYAFDVSGFSNEEADLVLVVGTDDDACQPWQSQDATDALQTAGYDARLVEIDGGNHANVIFHEIVSGEWLKLADDPAGKEVVQTILDAIEAAQQ